MECDVNRRVLEQRRAAERRGLDPDDPNVSLVLVTESFREAMRLLSPEIEEAAEVEEELPRDGVEIHEAGRRYLDAVNALCKRAGRSASGLAGEARLVSMILMTKTARLIDLLPVHREAIEREYVVLTLMLISHLERQAAAIVMAIGAEWSTGQLFAYRRARRDLRRLLDVHLEGVRRSERELVERMVAGGRAPSPFCVTIGPPLKAA